MVGHPGGWTVAYYTINFIRGVALFVIVALIGSGWQFIKPFLSDKDKQVFLVVIPLQVLDNIALIVIDETMPGARGEEKYDYCLLLFWNCVFNSRVLFFIIRLGFLEEPLSSY